MHLLPLERDNECSSVEWCLWGSSFSGQIKGLEWLSREFLACVDGDEAGGVSFCFIIKNRQGAFKTTMISCWISIEISCLFNRGQIFAKTGSRSLGVTQLANYGGIIG